MANVQMPINPPSAPEDCATAYVEDKSIAEMFLTTNGRLNRLRYFKRVLVLGVVATVLAFAIVTATMEPSGDDISTLGYVLFAVMCLIFAVPHFMLMIRPVDACARRQLAVCAVPAFGTRHTRSKQIRRRSNRRPRIKISSPTQKEPSEMFGRLFFLWDAHGYSSRSESLFGLLFGRGALVGDLSAVDRERHHARMREAETVLFAEVDGNVGARVGDFAQVSGRNKVFAVENLFACEFAVAPRAHVGRRSHEALTEHRRRRRHLRHL